MPMIGRCRALSECLWPWVFQCVLRCLHNLALVSRLSGCLSMLNWRQSPSVREITLIGFWGEKRWRKPLKPVAVVSMILAHKNDKVLTPVPFATFCQTYFQIERAALAGWIWKWRCSINSFYYSSPESSCVPFYMTNTGSMESHFLSCRCRTYKLVGHQLQSLGFVVVHLFGRMTGETRAKQKSPSSLILFSSVPSTRMRHIKISLMCMFWKERGTNTSFKSLKWLVIQKETI